MNAESNLLYQLSEQPTPFGMKIGKSIVRQMRKKRDRDRKYNNATKAADKRWRNIKMSGHAAKMSQQGIF